MGWTRHICPIMHTSHKQAPACSLPRAHLMHWCDALQVILADEGERVRNALDASTDLQGLLRATANASTLYRKTRAGASHESVTRAQAMPRAGVHPLLAQHVPAHAPAGLEAQVILSALPELQHSELRAPAVRRHLGQGSAACSTLWNSVGLGIELDFFANAEFGGRNAECAESFVKLEHVLNMGLKI